MQFVLFTDNLADLPLAEAAKAAKSAGFDGLDLTLRAGGHVLPANAEAGMAKARQAAEAVGISIPMVSTDITDSSSPHADSALAAAAHFGARHVKLGYWPYQPFGTLARQIDAAQERLARVIQLARRYNVLPCVHPHSGRFVAAGGQLLYFILRDFKPEEVGAYVDPMHMTIEGSLNGWELGLDLVANWIAVVGVKNFRWRPGNRDTQGQLRYRWEYVPLADGQAPLPEFVGYLKKLGFNGIVSLHSEYKGNSSFRPLATPELVEQSAADLRYLKSLWT
jgi:sugar phosphate isomerase/epimerase